MRMRTTLLTALGALAVAGFAGQALAQPYYDHDHYDHDHGYHHDNDWRAHEEHEHHGGYYAAPPVVYAPARPYYAPPPVVYSQPGVTFGVTIP